MSLLISISILFFLFACQSNTLKHDDEGNVSSGNSSELQGSSSSAKGSVSVGTEFDVASALKNHSPGPIEAQLSPKPCLAVFTKDYEVIDYFDDKLFSVKQGEVFMVNSGPEWFDKTSLFKEKDGHIIDFEIEGTENLPFEFTCDTETAQVNFTTFYKTDFYEEPELTTKVCSLPVGSVISTTETGYVAVSGEGMTQAVYEIFPEHQATECKGGKYVKGLEFELFGTTYVRAGIDSYLSGK